MLADGLRECQLCCHPLHLKDFVGGKQYGLGQILLVKCAHDGCSLINEFPTGSRHKTYAGGKAWDVNFKMVAGRSDIFQLDIVMWWYVIFSQILWLPIKLLIIGVIDAGLGEKQVNSLLSALNIPLIRPATIKRRERELVPHLGKMAEENCRKFDYMLIHLD